MLAIARSGQVKARTPQRSLTWVIGDSAPVSPPAALSGELRELNQKWSQNLNQYSNVGR